MPVFRRELAFTATRPMENTGDWWHLVFDTDSPGLYVEHSWTRASTHTQGQIERGIERFGINDFLTLAGVQPAQSTLMSVLREMFGASEPASQ